MIDTQKNYLDICLQEHLRIFALAAEGNPDIAPSPEKISNLVAEIFFGPSPEFESSRTFLAELIEPIARRHIEQYLKEH